MLRFILVAAAAFCALGCAMVLADADAQQSPRNAEAVAGEWTGKYICGQGITALDLDIKAGPNNTLTATFNFGPLPENPDVPKGSYRMEGAYDPVTRHVKLEGVKWIEYPQNYIMVGLDGHMTASGGRIWGMVPTLGNCSSFDVRREGSADLVS